MFRRVETRSSEPHFASRATARWASGRFEHHLSMMLHREERGGHASDAPSGIKPLAPIAMKCILRLWFESSVSKTAKCKLGLAAAEISYRSVAGPLQGSISLGIAATTHFEAVISRRTAFKSGSRISLAGSSQTSDANSRCASFSATAVLGHEATNIV